MLAARRRRILGLQEEGFFSVLVEGGNRMESRGVRHHSNLTVRIKAYCRVFFVRFPDQADRFPILAGSELIDAAQCIQAAVGEMIDDHGRSFVLVSLVHKGRVDGGERKLSGGMTSHIIRLHIRELADDAPGHEVDDGQRILRQFVARELVDPGLPSLLEFRLDQADGIILAVKQLDAISTGNIQGPDILFSGDADVEHPVTLLRIDGIGDDFPGRGEDDTAHALPTVVNIVVKGFLLGEGQRTDGHERHEGKQSFHITNHLMTDKST